MLEFFRSSTSLRPSIRGSVLYTWMNAWPTSNRFQSYQVECRFGCGQTSDRMEHYLSCPVLHAVASRLFQIDLGALEHPAHGSLMALLDSSDQGLRVACYIDGVRHAFLQAKHRRSGDPTTCIAAHLKRLMLLHPSLRLLLSVPGLPRSESR